ncbi:MAG: beta-lactamase family protein, partial [Verrucomicrobiae bacterium]|nr:beta-lactamase family protein [Verrucomicrobiae bacterium]
MTVVQGISQGLMRVDLAMHYPTEPAHFQDEGGFARGVCRTKSDKLLAPLSLLLALAAPAPIAATQPSIAPNLQPFVDSGTLAGAVVLVADTNGVLALETVGWMDVAGKRPMRTDCLFWIASQSKPITAAALMILVDEGKVSTDDPVEKYLPEFKDLWVAAESDKDHVLLKRPRHPILVREILSHTSGLPFKSPLEQPTLDLFPLEARVRSYAMMPLLFEPGTQSKYSNAGINTAARIVEVVAGMPFEKFLDDRILKPLGMKDTTFWPDAKQLRRLAKAYRPNASKDAIEECAIDQLKYPLDDPSRQPMPAGGLFSTAEDVSLFYRMLANNGTLAGRRILSESAVRQMTSDQSGEARSGYGFGIGVKGDTITHGGAYNTASAFDRERNIITVFLGQHAGWIKDGKDIIPAFQKAAADAFGPPPSMPPPPSAGAGTDPHRIVGIPGEAPERAVPAFRPAWKRDSIVFKEPGRYGGWPANHGLWQWGDELVVGFTAAFFKHATNDHAIDRSKPSQEWQARSMDGGLTWRTENSLPFSDPGAKPEPSPLGESLDFTAPDFALMFRFGSLHVGPSWFYVSTNRCRTWRGPFSFAVEGIERIAARTDLVPLGKRDCLMFGSAAKADGKEGRVFCARTTDGGLRWKLVSLIGPEPPAGFAIMPSSVRLPGGAIITSIRHGGGTRH